MIRHRPYGSEHPYATTNDQRVPSSPVAGESVVLGVAAANTVTNVSCEWTADNGTTTTTTLTLTPVDNTALDPADAGGEGHLAVAQAKAARGTSRSWQVRTPELLPHTSYRYRFTARKTDGAQRRSRVYTVTPSQWSPDPAGSTLTIDTDRILPDSIQWRRDVNGVNRVRFDLRLDPDEHVVRIRRTIRPPRPTRAHPRRGGVRTIQIPR